MAVGTPTILAHAADNVDRSTYTTASVSPVADRLILVAISVGRSDGTDIEPVSVTGNGITYARIDGGAVSTNTNLTLWRGMSGAPTAGAITIDFGGAAQGTCMWHVIEVANALVGSNGASAIVQSKFGGFLSGATTTATLDNAVGTNGAVLGYFHSNNGAGTWTVGAGHTALGTEGSALGPAITDRLQYDLTGTTTVSATYSVGSNRGVVGVEIAEGMSGAASSAVAWAGSAAGVNDPIGAGTGSVAWSGSATGARVSRGSAAGSVAWSGSVTGTTVRSGSAAGSVAWSGAATGAFAASGAASGAVGWAGSADGAADNLGAATGTIVWAGGAAGAADYQGAATETITWAGAATGTSAPSGSVTGSITWAGSVTGEFPVPSPPPEIEDPRVTLDANLAGATLDPNPYTATLDPNPLTVILDTNASAATLDTNPFSAALDANPATATADPNTTTAEWRLGVSTLKQNDTAPSAAATILNGSTPVDLTDATVKFNMAIAGQATKVSAAGVVSDAVNGRVRYDWIDGDTDTPGTYQCEWEITWDDDTIQTFPPSSYLNLTITAELDTTG